MTVGVLASLLALNIVESEDLAWVALWPRQGGQVGAAINPKVRAGVDEAPTKERPSKRRAGPRSARECSVSAC
jgi:hypothetical protein